jgi:hypothetical protein
MEFLNTGRMAEGVACCKGQLACCRPNTAVNASCGYMRRLTCHQSRRPLEHRQRMLQQARVRALRRHKVILCRPSSHHGRRRRGLRRRREDQPVGVGGPRSDGDRCDGLVDGRGARSARCCCVRCHLAGGGWATQRDRAVCAARAVVVCTACAAPHAPQPGVTPLSSYEDAMELVGRIRARPQSAGKVCRVQKRSPAQDLCVL